MGNKNEDASDNAPMSIPFEVISHIADVGDILNYVSPDEISALSTYLKPIRESYIQRLPIDLSRNASSVRDRVISELEARGWSICSTDIHLHTSRIYTVMCKPGNLYRYYVGKSGALRFGPTIAESYLDNVMRREILDEVTS